MFLFPDTRGWTPSEQICFSFKTPCETHFPITGDGGMLATNWSNSRSAGRNQDKECRRICFFVTLKFNCGLERFQNQL